MSILYPYLNATEVALTGSTSLVLNKMNNWIVDISADITTCGCGESSTRYFYISSNNYDTHDDPNITYTWYNNGSIVGTNSAITITSTSFNVSCILSNSITASVSSNTFTIQNCPNQSITKSYSDPWTYYSSAGGLGGIFDYLLNGTWVHGGSTRTWIRFSSLTGITLIRFYFWPGQGYCGLSGGFYEGMLYVNRGV